MTTFLPIFGVLVAGEVWPENTTLVGIVTAILAVVGYGLAWRGGRWLARYAGPGVDVQPAVWMGGGFVIWFLAKTDQGIAMLLASVVVLSLPTLAFWLGARHRPHEKRQSEVDAQSDRQSIAGRLRFLVLWAVFAALFAGYYLLLSLIRPWNLAFSQGLSIIIAYAVLVSGALWFVGRRLRALWRAKPVRLVAVVVPAIPTVLWPLALPGISTSALIIAIGAMLVPSVSFASALFFGRRHQ